MTRVEVPTFAPEEEDELLDDELLELEELLEDELLLEDEELLEDELLDEELLDPPSEPDSPGDSPPQPANNKLNAKMGNVFTDTMLS